MAKVSLRIYNRDIESLIDQNHLDEAIAHCRHILQTFSKHLDTYRLLGKAYLEAKRYEEAIDVFSRILMAVPDDFVAHVGMSIIRDDQSKLDDAIWHMERAFEAQPSNSAIQGELRRLFGRRDGVEPPKIRMTRGALAHMYVQGELYPQAISEIKAVLAQDANRDDMKSLLAQAYFHAGQKADASDICQQLLKRYPYSFDANRIMVELLQGSDSVETTQVYRHRVNELDPYATFTQASVFQSSDVSDAAINLERFDYKGQEVEQGDWSAAGIALGPSVANAEPEWLKNEYPASRAEEKPAPAAQSEPEIPDFLRQAGWSESSGTPEQPASIEAESTAESDLAPSDMPDWLKAMAPVEPEAAKPIEPTPSADTPDWLSGLNEAAEVSSATLTQEPASSGDVPSWLNNLDDTGAAMPSASSDDSLPDWLNPQPEKTTPSPEPEPFDLAHVEPDPVPPLTPTPAATLETLGTSLQEQDDAMAWLESLAAKHGAKPEELVTDPNARTDTPPDWVNQARALGEAQSAPVEATQVEEPVSQSAPILPEEIPQSEVPPADETGMWLRDLGEKESAGEDLFQVEPIKNEFSDSAADVADWLSSLDEAEARSEPLMTEPAASVEEEAVTDSSGLPDWLQGLDKIEEMPASAAVSEELPAWLQGEVEPPAQPERTAPTDWHPVAEPDQEPEPISEPEFKFEPEPELTSETEFKFEPEPEFDPGAKFEPEFKPAEIDFKPEPASPIPPKPAPRRTPSKPVKASSPEPTRSISAGHQTGMATPLVDPVLWTAQSDMNRGDIPAALEHFGRLIKKGKWLEEIIRDLRDALYRYPVEVTIWQTLGDAYMRENRLQEALDAYTKAEELLR